MLVAHTENKQNISYRLLFRERSGLPGKKRRGRQDRQTDRWWAVRPWLSWGWEAEPASLRSSYTAGEKSNGALLFPKLKGRKFISIESIGFGETENYVK